jgi:integrase
MVKGAPWKLRRIPDPLLREMITQAGIDNRWAVWARVLADLLFETGCRLGEACALTIGDWAKYSFRGEIDAPSKGSGGKRVKTLVLGRSALERLRLYVDGPRCQLSGHKLPDLQAMAARDLRLVADMPLLLNLAGAAPNSTVFRDDYWTPAARRLGLLDTPHYARHWFVTNAVAQIEAECGDGLLMDRELDLLCHYMHWRNGEMLYAYGGVRAILARHRAAEARQRVSFELFQRAELRIQRHPDLRRLVGERVP